MADSNTCDHTTQSGRTCRWRSDRGPCPYHTIRPAKETPPRRATRRRRSATPLPGRDVREVTWWVIERLMEKANGASRGEDGALETRDAQAITGAARLLVLLGPTAEDSAEALADLAVRGRIMHGLPPRDPAEWDRAARQFDDVALEEVRRWAKLLDVDDRDRVEDLLLGQGSADDAHPAVLEDEDG